MPYAFGVANDQHDVLGKLRAFLLDNGWTENLFADDITSRYTYGSSAGAAGKRLHMSKGGVYLNFRSLLRATPFQTYQASSSVVLDGLTCWACQMSGLAFYYSTGFNSSLAWDLQPGYPQYSSKGIGSAIWFTGAVPSYRFFLMENPFTLFIAIEYEVGKWRNGILGNTNKAFPFEGGEIVSGTCIIETPSYNAGGFFGDMPLLAVYGEAYGVTRYMRAVGLGPADSPDLLRGSISSSGARFGFVPGAARTGYLHMYEMLMMAMPSSFTGILPLTPMPVLRLVSSSDVTLLGEIAHVRQTIATGYQPGSIITMGTDRWMLMPLKGDNMAPAFVIPYDGV